MKLPNYMILDLETSVDNVGDGSTGTFAASPFYKGNQIVAYGWCSRDDPEIRTTYLEKPKWDLSKIDVIACHNSQFDMAYMLTRHTEELTDWLRNGGKIYDTMTAEYLLTNLLHKLPNLDDTCLKYGGEVKNDIIKEYWKAGISTEDIPKNELIPYLETDVENTHKIYLGQMKLAEEKGMTNLLDCHFEAMLALCSMNVNGLKFDVKFARQEAYRLSKELLQLKASTAKFMSGCFVPEFEINPGSDRQISTVLFGGPYKYKKRGPIINPEDGTLVRKKAREQVPKLDEDGNPTYYKSGNRKGEAILMWQPKEGEIKTKLYDYVGKVKGLGFVPRTNWQLKDKRYFSVGEDNLKVLSKQCKLKEQTDFLANVIKMNTIEKDLSTYFIGYTKLVWPDSGVIHPNFNTALTATGRLSSSAPNED